LLLLLLLLTLLLVLGAQGLRYIAAAAALPLPCAALQQLVRQAYAANLLPGACVLPSMALLARSVLTGAELGLAAAAAAAACWPGCCSMQAMAVQHQMHCKAKPATA
jgi:hypothetical protein